tara:strand:- start:221 stop:568 length:348 start_codon:yes stop_codon:yes gene_type:complete
VTEYWSAGIKNGKKHLRRICIECYKKVQSIYKKNKSDWYRNIKNNLACEKCGYSKLTHPSFSPRAIQFHHHKDNKLFSIGDSFRYGYGKKKIVEEIKKCKVLCSRCHAEEHDKLN